MACRKFEIWKGLHVRRTKFSRLWNYICFTCQLYLTFVSWMPPVFGVYNIAYLYFSMRLEIPLRKGSSANRLTSCCCRHNGKMRAMTEKVKRWAGWGKGCWMSASVDGHGVRMEVSQSYLWGQRLEPTLSRSYNSEATYLKASKIEFLDWGADK